TTIMGSYSLAATSPGTQVSGANTMVDFQSPVTSLGSTLVISDGLTHFSAPISIANLLLSGGTLSGGMPDGTSSITVTSQTAWTGGHLIGLGFTNIDPGAQLDIQGDATKYLDGGTLNIRPFTTVIWMGAGGIWVQDKSTLNNGGNFRAAGSNHFVFNGGTPQIINTGVF